MEQSILGIGGPALDGARLCRLRQDTTSTEMGRKSHDIQQKMRLVSNLLG